MKTSIRVEPPLRKAEANHGREGQLMLTVLGVLVGWIVLQLWVLPRLGVPT